MILIPVWNTSQAVRLSAQRWGGAVDWPAWRIRRQRREAVDWLAEDVDEAAECVLSDGDRDGSAGGLHGAFLGGGPP